MPQWQTKKTERDTMKQKDYKDIAELISRGLDPVTFAYELCGILDKAEPRFNQFTFLRDCGLMTEAGN